MKLIKEKKSEIDLYRRRRIKLVVLKILFR